MPQRCHYCEAIAVASRAATDLANSREHLVAYKQLPLCLIHAWDARNYGHRLWDLEGNEITPMDSLPDQTYAEDIA